MEEKTVWLVVWHIAGDEMGVDSVWSTEDAAVARGEEGQRTDKMGRSWYAVEYGLDCVDPSDDD